MPSGERDARTAECFRPGTPCLPRKENTHKKYSYLFMGRAVRTGGSYDVQEAMLLFPRFFGFSGFRDVDDVVQVNIRLLSDFILILRLQTPTFPFLVILCF